MRTRIRSIVLTSAAILMTVSAALASDDLLSSAKYVESVKNYRGAVERCLVEAGKQDTPEPVTKYLAAMLGVAETLKQTLSEDQTSLVVLRPSFFEAVGARTEAEMDLTDQDVPSDKKGLVRKETEAFNKYIGPYTKEFDKIKNKRRIELFNLKYFEEEDKAKANFFEGWINGQLPFTRFEADSEAWYRDTGVSKFEATFRFEPIIVIEEDNPFGFLVSTGMLYHLFPPAEKDSGILSTVGSEYVKRLGLRIGAGALDNDGLNFSGGAAIQVCSLSLYTLYDFEEDEWYWAVGLSDWDWLKDLVPYFGK